MKKKTYPRKMIYELIGLWKVDKRTVVKRIEENDLFCSHPASQKIISKYK